jgi:hypothetical protein
MDKNTGIPVYSWYSWDVLDLGGREGATVTLRHSKNASSAYVQNLWDGGLNILRGMMDQAGLS